MKTLLFCLCFFISGLQIQAQKLTIMTFNIRLDTPSDSLNQWKFRKENAASILLFNNVGICGMQEVLNSQLLDLQSLLPNFGYLGVGRDDGKTKGEYSPIFYNKQQYEVIESATFWLSQTPEKPGLGWDASYNRVVTWALFRDRKSKKKFYVFNTHFDHRGVVARKESAVLLLQKIKEIAGDKPTILLGDFNASPADKPFVILNEALKNTEKISVLPHFGPESTFNGFGQQEQPNRAIDHIFITPTTKIKILRHGTLSSTWNGRFASDHHPVLVEGQL